MDAIVIVALAVIAAGGAFIGLRLVFNRSSRSVVNQRDIQAKGDVAGRDINKHG